jgi:hypothetical protein
MDGANIVLELGCSGGGVCKGEETGPDTPVQATD